MKCQSCGATYEPTLRDGSKYFHACAPLVHVRVERDGKAEDVLLSDLKPTDTIDVIRGGAPAKTLVSEQRADDVRVGDTFVERANKRDENLKVIGFKKDGNAETAAKSEGAGSVQVG